MLILLCIFFIVILFFLILMLKYLIGQHARKLRCNELNDVIVVGFFHPYCNAGGGGERVLWVAIRALQNRYPNVKCIVYTGDTDSTGPEILNKARQRFNIVLPRPVEFIFLKRRNWVEASKYPIFTLLGQSLGSLFLGWEALLAHVPDIYVDSMGYAFTLPLFKYFGKCKVACYVHYPTISTDMLDRVSQRSASFNNASFVSRSSVLTSVKILYYRLFAYIYGLAGKCCDAIMVNSTWTYGHIKSLWKAGERTVIVYPPCDISEFLKIPLTDNRDKNVQKVLSIAQFRPEKDHRLQLESFFTFLAPFSDEEKEKFRLVLVGGCRDSKDAQRVETLQKYAKDELKIDEYVEFKLNVSFEELKELMSEATIGLHTMRDEHFGIGVVELMAAGTVVLAHNSGGPKLDIVTAYNGQTTGYLASDSVSYADAMTMIFNLTEKQSQEVREAARQSVARFSEKEFETGFLSVMEPLWTTVQASRDG